MDEIDEPVGQARAAELWLALIEDVTATPCQHPCLRDDLTDWLRGYYKRATPQRRALCEHGNGPTCPECAALNPKPSMSESQYPPSFNELDLEGGNGIKPEDIASYAWPPGERQRYTDAGWEKAKKLGIVPLRPEDFGAVGDSSHQEGEGHG